MISLCIFAATCLVEQEVRNSIKDPNLAPYLMAMAARESRFDARAVGQAGELGIFQLKPSTALGLRCITHAKQLFDIRINTICAEKYIVSLRSNEKDIYSTLRAYNAGPNRKYGKRNAKKHAYVKMILKEVDRQKYMVKY